MRTLSADQEKQQTGFHQLTCVKLQTEVALALDGNPLCKQWPMF